MVRDIIKFPNYPLTVKAFPVRFPLSEQDRKLVEDLQDTVRAVRAAGLAANQVGILRRVIATAGFPAFAINPTWTVRKGATLATASEGCMSQPGKRYAVSRYVRIDAKWQYLDGTERTAELRGWDARVFQHEVDHLEGQNIGTMLDLLRDSGVDLNLVADTSR